MSFADVQVSLQRFQLQIVINNLSVQIKPSILLHQHLISLSIKHRPIQRQGSF